MKRDTGDEIRMKLRYGRSNPCGFRFDAFYHFPLPPAGHPATICPCVATYKGCATSNSTRRKRFVFIFVFPFLLLLLPLSLFLLFSRGNSRSVFNIFQNSVE